MKKLLKGLAKGLGKLWYGVSHAKLSFKAIIEGRNKLFKEDEKFERLNNLANDEDYVNDGNGYANNSRKKGKKKFKNPFKNKLFSNDETYDKLYDTVMNQRILDKENLSDEDILNYINVYLSDLGLTDDEKIDLHNNIQKLLNNPATKKELINRLKNMKYVTGRQKYSDLKKVIDDVNHLKMVINDLNKTGNDNNSNKGNEEQNKKNQFNKTKSEKIGKLSDIVLNYLTDTILDNGTAMELYNNTVKIVELGKENELKEYIEKNSRISSCDRYEAVIKAMTDIINCKTKEDNISDILNFTKLKEYNDVIAKLKAKLDEEIESAKATSKSEESNAESNDIFDGLDEEIESAKATSKSEESNSESSDNKQVIDSNVIEVNPEIINDNNKDGNVIDSNIIEKKPLPYVALSGMNIDTLNEILSKDILSECELISLNSELVNLKNRFTINIDIETIPENYILVIEAIENKLPRKTVHNKLGELSSKNADRLERLINNEKISMAELIGLRSELAHLRDDNNSHIYDDIIDDVEMKLSMK